METETAVSAALMWAGISSGPSQAVDDIAHGCIAGRWHQSPEEGIEITPDIGIGILLNDQGTGGMAHEEGEQPDRAAGFADEKPRGLGDLIEAGARLSER